MWKSRQFAAAAATPNLPAGVRIYAIGDIHGRADLLEQLFERIDADLAKHPVATAIEIFIGDYIDRGPKSAEVLSQLVTRGKTHRTICLKGNHEIYILEFLRNPAILKSWAQFGGLTTLLSYGLKPSLNPGDEEQAELAEELARVLPHSHRQFLGALPLSFTCGDFFFVHAGVRPSELLSHQRDEDLLWIRDEFLSHEDAFEKIVVHGHTPVMEPDVRRNRINIDTGAYATGRLTCLRLEGDEISFI
ncbi:metallophosphoesterase family protein [Methylocella sp.]|jgi:serine/threonine protein phosphatase 1|uniref:metallophosphoesterase family protein n=1 Tax=Methylocella sp. TaxID=1978226 RepID=UPI003C1F6470